MNFIRILVSGAVFLCFSCGPEYKSEQASLNHEKMPSDEPQQDALVTTFNDSQFPIACYYFDPNSSDYGQGLLKKNAWVWGNIKGYEHIAAKGRVQDGFLVADEIEAVDWLHETKTVAHTLDQLEKICQDSIDRSYPKKGLKLYKFRAYQSRLPGASKYSIVMLPEERLKSHKITRLLVFGDSLSDVGRLQSSLKIFPSSPYFLGRFSNGPVWSDILQITANLAMQNRSKGGAVTDPNIDFNISEIISMVRDGGRGLVTGSSLKTVRDFLQNKTVNKKFEDPNKTLIMVWIGANDYVAKFDTVDDMTTLINDPDAIKKGGKWVARFSVRNILDQLRVLYNAGGRNFFVGNLPNMGASPMVMNSPNYVAKHLIGRDRNYYLSTKMTEISQYHNTLLQEGLLRLQAELPQAQFILFDAYDVLDKIIAGVGPDGEANFDWGIDRASSFVELASSGKPPIRVGKACYTGGYLGGNDRKICKNSRSVLFWDEVHPTAAGHCSLAFMMHKQLYETGFIATRPHFKDYLELCKINYAR